MDLTQLRYFARIASLKSFSRASTQLHVAQPALTRQIKMLEDEFGMQLLIRHSRGVEPTESGTILMNGAEAVLRLIDSIRDEVIASATEPSGVVRVGFPPSLGPIMVENFVPVLQERFPRIRLQISEGYSQTLRADLLSDRLDLAVTSEVGSDPLLDASPLFQEEMWLLMSKHSPWAKSKEISLEELATIPVIQPTQVAYYRGMIGRRLATLGLELNLVMEVESPRVTQALIQKGVGCHVSPFSMVADYLRFGDVVGCPIANLSIRRLLQRRVDRQLTPAVTAISKSIESAAGALVQKYSPALRPVAD